MCNQYTKKFPSVEAQLKNRHETHLALIRVCKCHLGGKCVKCGGTDYSMLQFDHIDSTLKLYNIAQILKPTKLNRLFDELEKCQLLCKKCHEYKSIFDRGTKPLQGHGTFNMYANYKCRCVECVKAGKEHNRAMYVKNKEYILTSRKAAYETNKEFFKIKSQHVHEESYIPVVRVSI